MTPDQGQSGQSNGGFVPGPFGGQIPVPPTSGEGTENTIPSFQFNKDDFEVPTQNTSTSSDVVDPFAGGIASLQNTGPTTESVVISGETTLDDMQKIDNTTTIPSFDIPVPSFDIPTVQESTPAAVDNTPLPVVVDTSSIVVENNSGNESTPTIDQTQNTVVTTETTSPAGGVSFNIPENTEATDNNGFENTSVSVVDQTQNAVLPTENNAVEGVSFDIPEATNIAETANTIDNLNSPETTPSGNTPLSDTIAENDQDNTTEYTPSDENLTTKQDVSIGNISDMPTDDMNQQSETNINKSEATTQEEIKEEITIDNVTDNTVTAAVNEVYIDPVTNPLLETYELFVKNLTDLLNLKNTQSITITGHRTNEEEVQYEFVKVDSTTTAIKHHHLLVTDTETTQTLLFDTANGLYVKLNEEELGYYGTEQDDADTAYYLKDKLNKFITIISDEYKQEERKSREESNKKKKTLEILRSF